MNSISKSYQKRQGFSACNVEKLGMDMVTRLNFHHSLFHDGLEVITEVSVEGVLVEGLVNDLISGRHIPDSRDEQHCPDWTTPALPLTHTQVLQQHHAVHK